MDWTYTHLKDRSALLIGGADAATLLGNLVTCALPSKEHPVSFGALLTPQGKILFDFFLHLNAVGDEASPSYILELGQDSLPALQKRLMMYKLRADVSIEIADELAVWVCFAASTEGEPASLPEGFDVDPRLPQIGGRAIARTSERFAQLAQSETATWQEHLLGLGIGESGRDYELGSVFPHDVNMDQLNGIDFSKGCYVGQEVVSRMKHRGTARRRLVCASASAPLPDAGTDIVASEKAVGVMGSSHNGVAVALVRLDRVSTALAAGTALTTNGIPIALHVPTYAGFQLDIAG
ncbi:YgfZ/GcvT domain-containing protein [Polycladidibacter hongkongensis]|uniref:CAF17-like 4Fe-4S cluster assembly/insertion protein YgfZ n=1 Tax=Polycladidibacter hongkongensis TaxID=1647556 RepID=UPI0008329592|nr:folate-binding protein YgfZ [Pseudovibrio hongkongensis]